MMHLPSKFCPPTRVGKNQLLPASAARSDSVGHLTTPPPELTASLSEVEAVMEDNNSKSVCFDPEAIPSSDDGGLQQQQQGGRSVSGPLHLAPNSPHSRQAAQKPGIATLRYPAISRVLKVSKLHEPYINRKDRRERSKIGLFGSIIPSGLASATASEQGYLGQDGHHPRSLGSVLIPVREEEEFRRLSTNLSEYASQSEELPRISAATFTLSQSLADEALMDSATDGPMR